MRRGIFLMAVLLPLPVTAADGPAGEARATAVDPRAVEARAAAHLEEGNRRLEQEDYEGAIREYKAGYAVYPRASLLFNIGLAEARRGRPLEAAEAFEGVLGRKDEASPEALALAREQLARLERQTALLEIRGRPSGSAPGAEIRVDGRPRGTLPLPAPLRLLPGEHEVEARKPGHAPFGRRVSLPRGGREVVEVTLEAIPPPPEVRPSRRHLWIWGAVGAVAATAAVVGYLSLRGGDGCVESRTDKEGVLCFNR